MAREPRPPILRHCSGEPHCAPKTSPFRLELAVTHRDMSRRVPKCPLQDRTGPNKQQARASPRTGCSVRPHQVDSATEAGHQYAQSETVPHRSIQGAPQGAFLMSRTRGPKMSACPNTTDNGCRCWEHAPGLATHAKDPVSYLAALYTPTPTTARLMVVTAGPRTEPTCDGTMTCSCPTCVVEKTTRVGAGDRQQPWDVRPARKVA